MSDKPRDASEEEVSEAPVEEKQLDKEISDLLGPWMEKNDISEALVFARPAKSDDLVIFYRGHFFDVTKLLTKVYRKFRSEVADALGE